MKFALNSIDKNMLACERESFAFNSHLIADFALPLDEHKLKLAAETLFRDALILRTVILNGERVVAEKAQTKLTLSQITPELEHSFFTRPFALDREPPARLLYGKLDETSWRLIMTVHHSAFDGMAQGLLFKELLRIYQGEKISDWAKAITVFRYRDLFLKRFGWRSLMILPQMFLQLLLHPRQKSATLMRSPELKRRECVLKMIELSVNDTRNLHARAKELKLNFFELVCVAVLRSLNAAIHDKHSKPVSLIIPVDLRSVLRENRFFQNVMGQIRFGFSSEEIEARDFPTVFKATLKKRSALTPMLAQLLPAGLYASLVSLETLRRKIQTLDEDPEFIYGSVLVSAIRIPLSFDLSALNIRRIFGHGSMFKSPGLGVILTGSKERPIIVIEYLQDLFAEQDIARFKAALLKELESHAPSSSSGDSHS